MSTRLPPGAIAADDAISRVYAEGDWDLPSRWWLEKLRDAALEAAAPAIRADERARLRSLVPYNVNCCDGFPAAVADILGEHGDTP